MPTGLTRSQNIQTEGPGTCIAVTATSQSVLLPVVGISAQATDMMIFNAGASSAFIVLSDSPTTALAPIPGTPANGIIVASGVYLTFDRGQFAYISAVSPSTTTLYVYIGVGS